jgi:LuxR family maltose regulon positive regulatory protein
LELAARSGDVLYQAYSNLCLLRVLYSNGDLAGALDLIQSIQNAAREYDLPRWAAFRLSAWQVRVWLAQDNLEAASQWVRERELSPDGDLEYPHEIEYKTFARVLIAQGRLDGATRQLDRAAALLQRLLEAADAGGRLAAVIEITLLQALAYQAGGQPERSMEALEGALALAEPRGFVRTFVDEGPPAARLLYDALKRGIAPEYVRRLLAVFPVTEPEHTDSSKSQATDSGLIEPLSERELEVLALIAEGLTNPEIASRLFLALNTVKGHTRSIYGKLGVHNRTQAVARARALGLLSFP